MKELTQSSKKQLIEAQNLITAGIDSIAAGCKKFVEILDEDRAATLAFLQSRGIRDEMLDLMENVGRGRLHPRLLFLPGPGPERLQRAPIAEQERLLNVGVEVVRLVGEEIKTTVKPVGELTRQEAELAIDSTGNTARDLQVERLKNRLLSTAFKLPPYFLDGDELCVRRDARPRIPFTELERLYHAAKEAHDKKARLLESDLKKRQIQR